MNQTPTMRSLLNWLGIWVLACAFVSSTSAQDSQINTLGDWQVKPIFTVGETINDYTPPGILDGLGAMPLEDGTIRVFANHEFQAVQGYPYALANGTELTGARVSYFDIDPNTREIIGSGLAYDTIIDRFGEEVTSGTQIDPANTDLDGIRRLCSSALFMAGEFGLEDTIYFTGEETGGGQEFALDVENGVLYALPWLGRAAWENITMIDLELDGFVGIVVGDDRQGAPLLVYVGQKNFIGDGSFLDRNGLAAGALLAWVADDGSLSPEDWSGTGTSRNGRFFEVPFYDEAKADSPGYDALGFADQDTQDAMVDSLGAFQFSRPEDVSTNPENGLQVIFASTGRGSAYPADDWGTMYLIDINVASQSAELTIVYDGDDAGAGQFSDPDFGLRSPDNLDWADDGYVYVQEDRSTSNAVFGGASDEEASIWQMDPFDGELKRIAQVNRAAMLPDSQTDGDPNDLGDWETSGILDVTSLFPTESGERLLIGDVQAHSVRDGSIEEFNLVQGGQLFFMNSFRSTTPFMTAEASQVQGLMWDANPVFTVGETIEGYTPPGILDGTGATKMDDGTVRVFVNHELRQAQGYAYTLANGTTLTGARVSYFDFDPATRKILGSGLAYDKIYDAAGNEVTSGTQIDLSNADTEGLRRLCSANLFDAGEYNLEDTIFFTGEETGGGLEYALDVENNELYALPWLGRAAWESVTLMDAGDENKVAILVGDDRQGAPLLLYLGDKVAGGSFIERNGLANGNLYVWVAEDGALSPEDFSGTSNAKGGSFVEIDIYDPAMAGANGYDALGFATQETQDALASEVGAFQFSRPEDVSTNPFNGTEAVMASTGRGSAYPSDDWGTTYFVNIDFSTLEASVFIIYDGDDAGSGQFDDPDFGLRSPDNLDWADNGKIYLQEDRSTSNAEFGGVSGEEASIWELDPSSGLLKRIGQVDRMAALPSGQTDGDPGDLGDWETSGVLDVTNLFDTVDGETLLLFDVQAHSVRDGSIESLNLVQGGQLSFLSTIDVTMNTPFMTDEESQLNGMDYDVMPVFTVGETINGYRPAGILDGIGAEKLEDGTVRMYVNHELTQGAGYAYTLANGTSLTGARVSYFDFDPVTRKILGSGLAYSRIVDGDGNDVTVGTQIAAGNADTEGLRRLCSSGLFNAGEFNLEDTIYFTGEETGGGLEYALDTENSVLYALPWLGRAAWENVTLLDPGDDNKVAVLVGDDRQGAPLLLYIGEKVPGGSFVERNGLANGDLYVWVEDNGAVVPGDFVGTGNSTTGTFVEIEIYDGSNFLDQAAQDELSEAAGAFQFSRPEDVATNPADGTQAVFASTGRGSAYPEDDWGTTYLVDVDFENLTAELTILYDGDDAGAGQFSDPDFGLRSPDNLDWADNGYIYIQEDRSTSNATFGGTSGEEASIWKMNPTDGSLVRVGQVNRAATLPVGQTDGDPGDLGDWETSGILDVTSLFETEEDEILLVGDVQAHSVRDGSIADFNLVQGGQLFFMSSVEDTSEPSLFALVDADNDVAIAGFDPIVQEAVLDLGALPGALNITVDVSPLMEQADAVEFVLNGTSVRTEFVAPYSLFGDVSGDFAPGTLPVGDHILEAYALVNGDRMAAASVSFSVVNGSALSVNSFIVIDAETDSELFPLTTGASVSVGDLPAGVNLMAKTGSLVKSVLFDINGGFYQRVENVKPFALFGDIGGDFLPGGLPVGDHVLTVTPYSDVMLGGEAGVPLVVNFSITGGAGKSSAMASGYSVEPVEGIQRDIPTEFSLEANYPNPFNPVTTIAFNLPEAANVQIVVYDVLGRQVATLVDASLSAGQHEVQFDAANLPSGTYFYSFVTPGETFTKKMLLLK